MKESHILDVPEKPLFLKGKIQEKGEALPVKKKKKFCIRMATEIC